ncbi:MAG: hypothetical protein KatS3mg121_0174 [Gammaproteobacteria bacterium]|nr:MAG: hypothetical protein KatS3mg121_0174 [Gammaproteobacteria bacterium]
MWKWAFIGSLLAAACMVPSIALPSDADAPALAAEFETRFGKQAARRWRLLRDAARIEVQERVPGVSELWLLEGGGRIRHLRLYHEARAGIEYDAADLRLLEAVPDWRALGRVVDPARLERLGPPEPAERFARWPARRYARDGQEVVWIPALQLPARIAEGEAVTRLLAVHTPAAAAPWRFTDPGAYRLIDYADLGDMERDPFVMRLLEIDPDAAGVAHHGH